MKKCRQNKIHNSVTQPGSQYGTINTDRYSCVSLITRCSSSLFSVIFQYSRREARLLMCTLVKYTVMVLNCSICLAENRLVSI